MSVFDSTAIGLAAQAPGGVADNAPKAGAGAPPVDKADDQPPADDKTTGDGKPPASDAVKGILEKHGLDSPEQLGELLDSVTGMRSKLGEADLDELMESHQTLQAYRKEWAKQERLQQKENEKPEETITRLERELEERDAKAAKGEKQRKQAEAAKKQIIEFNATISTGIEADESIPQEYRPFLAALMGVKNPVNDVDIRDKATVRKVLKTFGAKLVNDFEQAVIKRYRAGKDTMPATPPPAGGDQAPVQAEKKVSNLSEARRLAHASLGALMGKR